MNGKVKVILVEDDLDLRESLVECLILAGHEALGVGSALEFYRELARSSFSIAVVDVGLPDDCGFELAKYLRKNTGMGIIMLTARDSVEDRVHGYDSGADLYMVKPVDSRELSSAISSLALRLGGIAAPPEEEPAPEEVPNVWQLIKQQWYLLTPMGAAILLTAKEMEFMQCLAEQPGTAVPRETMLAALGYRDDEYAS
ncbi:response regulator transcription factor, partial [Geomonas sp.]|uniref:response regulator transcription factor n=1 Tax=Geomonas sp. TaxID=2651584 RepID=UPI002B4A4CB4